MFLLKKICSALIIILFSTVCSTEDLLQNISKLVPSSEPTSIPTTISPSTMRPSSMPTKGYKVVLKFRISQRLEWVTLAMYTENYNLTSKIFKLTVVEVSSLISV